MILKRMTATFGKLEREQLDLEPGLNVIEAPNESGKSTWAAFLLSMLYGIDTAQRSSRTNLPDKTKYKPWSGQPMEGSLELQWQGRPVTIQRTGSDRAPMREFSAFDSETGNAVPLTESTCGQTLIGVERSVYERSGFLSFRCMAISGDHALEARLNALVSSGEESFSYTQVEKRLRDQRNRLRHNRLGLLPQAEEELRQVRQQMETLETLNREYRELEARREQLTEQEKQLSEQLSRLQAQALSGKRQQLEAARQDWEKKSAFLQQKAESVAALPPLETLSATQGQLDATVDGLRQLESMVDLRKPMTPLEPPQCPPGFEGLTTEQVHETVEAECARLERLRCPPLYDGGAPGRMTGIAVAMGALAVLGLFLKLWAMVIFGLVLAVVFAVQAGARANRNHRARMQYRAILDRYDVDSMDELVDLCDSWRETLEEYSRQTAELKRQRNAWEIQMTHLGERMTELMAAVRAFAPESSDVTQAKAAIQRAIHLQQFYTAAQREEQNARSRYEALQEAIGPLPEPAADGSEIDGDPEEVSGQLETVRQELAEVRSQMDLRRGRMEADGDPAQWSAKESVLTSKIARMQRRLDALNLALDALSQANETLQTRFSPQLNRLAGQYMARLTDGRYDQVLLDQNLQVTARPAGQAINRPLQALSCGTGDQLYLAVRLAICDLVLPPEAPLVLDDALAVFDDERMGAALSLLRELAQKRQILLFTCHTREKAWLESHPEPQN